MTLFIVTPSYIDSPARAAFARKSIESLREAIGPDYEHIVVDDYPRPRGFFSKWRIDPEFRDEAERIYDRPRTTLIRRRGGGSASAVLRALREARARGARYVFIHLDDNVYVPILGRLVDRAIRAFERDADLVKVRVAGYPILWGECTPELGNQTCLSIQKDSVSFDRIVLQPTRYEDFTLWWADLSEDMKGDRSYPIVLWSAIYRVDFLERVLTYRRALARGTLADVERYFMKSRNWRLALREFSGKLGYINMQFGGIEMQHNANWEKMVRFPNRPVR
ncbi:glycosyltransferase family 2 protein [Candidatus Sumerlaeota bacterium]|nr:glycosyltransferase family 2 protein [Candidatus Sumerlaeota bacterium]